MEKSKSVKAVFVEMNIRVGGSAPNACPLKQLQDPLIIKQT